MGSFVYIDESGDTGFRFAKGSSRFFVVTMLMTSDPIPLNAEIDEFRRINHFREGHEFKFYSSPESLRVRLLRLLLRHECRIRALVVDKQSFDPSLVDSTSDFYDYLVGMLLQSGGSQTSETSLILDRRDKRKAPQGIGAYLRRAINADGTQRVRGIKYHDSRRDNLLQAVDWASGAIYATYHRDNAAYMNVIRSRIEDIWHFVP